MVVVVSTESAYVVEPQNGPQDCGRAVSGIVTINGEVVDNGSLLVECGCWLVSDLGVARV
jgi:hypothetical protein